ncbi:hypothetical protein PUN28_014813 [Cardiocondyla obscurior]|uniref:Uncharacterized protein n=1 Tax=Cardiocondyla obscurior TaxID=286306 RepID=A0AAW2EXD4_9HYME
MLNSLPKFWELTRSPPMRKKCTYGRRGYVQNVREVTPQLAADRERDVKVPTTQSWKGIARERESV